MLGWFKRRRSPDNKALEDCMRALAQGDSAEKRRAFYAALRASTLLIATPGMEPDGRVKVAEGPMAIRFIATTDLDGMTAMLVFTNEAALLAWRPAGCVYTALAARDVFHLALRGPADHILINVSGPAGGRLSRIEISALAEGVEPIEGAQRLAAGTRIEILVSASPPPDALVEALRAGAGASASIRALYVVTAIIGAGEPGWLVGIELAPDVSPEAAVDPMRQAVQPFLGKERLTFLPLQEDTLATNIRERGLRVI